MSTAVNLVVGLVVLAWLCWRQTQRRLVREDRRPTVLLILALLGVLSLARFFQSGAPGSTAVLLLAASLVVAALFGVVRAYTVRLWRADGNLWRQGTWLTVVLWIGAVAVHIGLDFVIDATGSAKGLGSSSILLYLAVSLGAQRIVVGSRAQHVVAA